MSDKKPDFSNVVGGSSSTAEPAPAGSWVHRSRASTWCRRATRCRNRQAVLRQHHRLAPNLRGQPRSHQGSRLIQPGWKLTIPEETGDEGGVA